MALAPIRDPLFSSLFAEGDWLLAPFKAASRQTQLSTVTPKLDIVETKDNVIITAELPGLTKDQVSINLEDNVLTISGSVEHSKERTEEGTSVHYSERSYGRFSRSCSVPRGTKADQIKASLDNGLLRVTVPARAEKKEAARITVA